MCQLLSGSTPYLLEASIIHNLNLTLINCVIACKIITFPLSSRNFIYKSTSYDVSNIFNTKVSLQVMQCNHNNIRSITSKVIVIDFVRNSFFPINLNKWVFSFPLIWFQIFCLFYFDIQIMLCYTMVLDIFFIFFPSKSFSPFFYSKMSHPTKQIMVHSFGMFFCVFCNLI